jgi:hypothetical protein
MELRNLEGIAIQGFVTWMIDKGQRVVVALPKGRSFLKEEAHEKRFNPGDLYSRSPF